MYKRFYMAINYGSLSPNAELCGVPIITILCKMKDCTNRDKCISLLLEKDVDLNRKDLQGRTPIFYIVKDIILMKCFIAKGAKTDIVDDADVSFCDILVSV